MKLEGGCYCGSVRYEADGEPMMKAQCHCRECQYISGGAPNMFVLMPAGGLRYTKGAPRQFTRSDLERPVTREFCAECGTHMVTRPAGRGDQGRHARQPGAVRRTADGDLHRRQTGFPYDPRGDAKLRTAAGAASIICGFSHAGTRCGVRGRHVLTDNCGEGFAPPSRIAESRKPASSLRCKIASQFCREHLALTSAPRMRGIQHAAAYPFHR
jgi:hypothetical protein